jgi:hypothetical protein
MERKHMNNHRSRFSTTYGVEDKVLVHIFEQTASHIINPTTSLFFMWQASKY